MAVASIPVAAWKTTPSAGAGSNLFNLGRHLVAAGHYRTLRQGAYASCDGAVAI
jgi:hypothetical protein